VPTSPIESAPSAPEEILEAIHQTQFAIVGAVETCARGVARAVPSLPTVGSRSTVDDLIESSFDFVRGMLGVQREALRSLVSTPPPAVRGARPLSRPTDAEGSPSAVAQSASTAPARPPAPAPPAGPPGVPKPESLKPKAPKAAASGPIPAKPRARKPGAANPEGAKPPATRRAGGAAKAATGRKPASDGGSTDGGKRAGEEESTS
jgi:hypothetical protein